MAGGLCLRRISYPTPRNVTDRLREPKAHATTAKTTSKPVWRRTHFCHPPTAHRSTFIEIKALLVFSLWRQIASKGCGGEIGRKTVIIFRVSRSQFLLRRLVLWMSKRLSDCVSLFEGHFLLYFCMQCLKLNPLYMPSCSPRSVSCFLQFFSVPNLCKRIHFIFLRPRHNRLAHTISDDILHVVSQFLCFSCRLQRPSWRTGWRRETESSWHHFSFIESIELLRLYNDDVWTLETVFSTFLNRCQRHAKWIIFSVASYDISCFSFRWSLWAVYGYDVGRMVRG